MKGSRTRFRFCRRIGHPLRRRLLALVLLIVPWHSGLDLLEAGVATVHDHLQKGVMAMANRTGSKARHSGRSASKRSSTNRSRAAASRTRINSLQEELEKAAAGLYHVSESDYPFRFFTLPAWNVTALTAEEFLNCLGLSVMFIDEVEVPIGKFIEERVLDGFFRTIDELADYHGTDTSDPEVIAESKRFRKLEAILRKRLRDVKVFRVGFVEVHCYIAGMYKDNVAGLVTIAVET